jgi:hypothetical protein
MGISIRQVRLDSEGSGAPSEQAALNTRHPLLFRPLSHRLAWNEHHQDYPNIDDKLHNCEDM